MGLSGAFLWHVSNLHTQFTATMLAHQQVAAKPGLRAQRASRTTVRVAATSGRTTIHRLIKEHGVLLVPGGGPRLIVTIFSCKHGPGGFLQAIIDPSLNNTCTA